LIQLDNDALRAAVEANPVQTVEELASELHVTHSYIHRHLQKLGKWDFPCINASTEAAAS